MSTQRDELARLMNQEMGYIIDSRLSATSTAAVLRTAAAKVLAFLDRKPQQVTTVEELDALPVGTVVLSDEVKHHEGGWALSYQRWQDGDWHRGARSGSTHPDNFLPATVLHVGGAE